MTSSRWLRPIKKLLRPLTGRLSRFRVAHDRHEAIRAAVTSARSEAEAEGAAATYEGPTIKQIVRFDDQIARKRPLALFAHFDPAGEVQLSTLNFLKAIQKLGFEITFLTMSPVLPDISVTKLRSLVTTLVWRVNVGHDFGAWVDGMKLSDDLADRPGVLLTNDSNYGPLTDVGGIIEGFDDRADIWALTESLEIVRHLQSYFIFFRPRVLQSNAFKEFWSAYRIVPGRTWAIHFGELALSGFFRSRGFRLRAVISYGAAKRAFLKRNRASKVRKNALQPNSSRGRAETAHLLADGHKVNPTHYFWRELLDDFGAPFVKRDLVDRNPEGIADVAELRSRVDTWLAKL